MITGLKSHSGAAERDGVFQTTPRRAPSLHPGCFLALFQESCPCHTFQSTRLMLKKRQSLLLRSRKPVPSGNDPFRCLPGLCAGGSTRERAWGHPSARASGAHTLRLLRSPGQRPSGTAGTALKRKLRSRAPIEVEFCFLKELLKLPWLSRGTEDPFPGRPACFALGKLLHNSEK